MEEKIYTVNHIIENNIDKTAYGFIYITTNTYNNKKYIGQKKFQKGDHKFDWITYLGSGIHLKRAIKKYGKENFYKDIVAIAYSKKELDDEEIKFINKYDATQDNNYYNIAGGGYKNPFLGKSIEEIKSIYKKIGESNKGKKITEQHRLKLIKANTGRIVSQEQRNKISIKNKGENNGMFGKRGKDSPFYGRSLPEETKAKISKSIKGMFKGENHPLCRKIICLTTMEIFNYTKEAEEKYKEYGCRHQNIIHVCKGRRKSCGKLRNGTKLEWMYYEDYLKQA